MDTKDKFSTTFVISRDLRARIEEHCQKTDHSFGMAVRAALEAHYPQAGNPDQTVEVNV
jgi:hypothetical protein